MNQSLHEIVLDLEPAVAAKLFALGEHVLRRELQLFKRATLHALITDHGLNPAGLDVSRFTTAQLVAFIVTAIEVQRGRSQP